MSKIIAFDCDEVREYFLKIDKEQTTPFQIAVLDVYERAHVRNLLNREGHFGPIEAVRLGVRGWGNLTNKKGTPIAVETEEIDIPGLGKKTVLTKKCVNFLKHYIDELALQVIRENELTEQDSKNSASPSTQTT